MDVLKESESVQKRAATAEETPNKRGKQRAAIVAATILTVLLAGYFTGRSYCTTHFPPGSIVSGVDASWMTADELAKTLDESVSGYQNEVSGDGISFTLTAEDLQMTVGGQEAAQTALAKCNAATWPLGLFSKTAIATSSDVQVSRQNVADAVADVVWEFNQTASYPTDAWIAYDEETAQYEIVPEELGTLLDTDAVTEAILKDALVLNEHTTLDEAQLARPAIVSDSPSMASACDKANRMIALTIPITFNDEQICQVSNDEIRPTITFDYSYGNVSPHVDLDLMWYWCWATLNDLVNGETETLVWEVSSWDTASDLVPRIEALDDSPLEVSTMIILERPPESEGHELYGRHIDVNITTQYARLYDTDGTTVLWRSPVVTGNPNEGNGTAQGWFTMDWRDEDITLLGPTDEETGEPEWESPVRWWMGFYMNSDGFHDADWRWEGEFGGDTYLYAGSHGCVNLPIDKAGELWELTDYGEKVHVHE